MLMLKKLCVYCGANPGDRPIYTQMAQELGEILAQKGISLVYGGAKRGLMGVVANAVMQHGGEVIGVIPQFLVEKEVAHHSLTQLHIVNNMHERKALMAELADGFIMMPGGIGSLEEFFEVWTAGQLSLHQKPCGILNTENYYHHLLKFIDHAVGSSFIKPAYREMIIVDQSPKNLLEKFSAYQAPTETKWILDKEVGLQLIEEV